MANGWYLSTSAWLLIVGLHYYYTFSLQRLHVYFDQFSSIILKTLVYIVIP